MFISSSGKWKEIRQALAEGVSDHENVHLPLIEYISTIVLERVQLKPIQRAFPNNVLETENNGDKFEQHFELELLFLV